MSTLYIDECGFTGSDLLSDDQPFFVVGSLLLSDEETTEWAGILKPATQAPELKFSTLVRRARGRAAMVEFVQRLDANQGRLRCHFIHKRYALLGKVLDLLVEPMYDASGQDFYRDGYNLAYLNALFAVAVSTAPQETVDLLRAFLQLCRQPAHVNIARFWLSVRRLSNISEPLRELCEEILQAVEAFGFLRQILDRSGLALMTPSVIRLARQWNEEVDGQLSIVADSSNELFRSRDMLEAFSDQSMPEVMQSASNQVVGLPLRIADLQLVDSESSSGVQLADITAGLVNHVQNTLDDRTRSIDGFTEAITPLVTEWPPMLQVIPEQKFTPKELGRVGFDGHRMLGPGIEALRRLHESRDA